VEEEARSCDDPCSRPHDAAGLSAAAVAQDESPAAEAASPAASEQLDGTGVDIELIVKENINPFWVWMIQGATARAEQLGANLHACWGETDPDPEGQTACIENAMARGATTILIAPSNAGVTPAIEAAREAGLMVIALDTKTDPPDAVDVTFATDNFQAGLLIGQWAKAKLGAEAENAVIGLIDIQGAEGEPVVGVQRDQGFLQGFGIDVGDINLIGDETDPRIAGAEAGHGNQEDSVGAMERLLQANPNINLLYTINEPTARGAVQALETFGKTTDDVMIVSVDGGCEAMQDIEDGIIDATSQQYPSLMASLGVDWAVRFAQTGQIPTPQDSPNYTEGLDIYNTGATLITNDPQEGVDSIDTTAGRDICWGNFRGE
jgi:fructose transport system substrate-binding protein